MKKVLLFSLVFVLLIGIFGFVSAQEDLGLEDISNDDITSLGDELTDEVEAGFINGLDRAIDSIRLALSGNNPGVGLKIAQERLEELKKLNADGNIEEADRVAEHHRKIMIKIRTKIENSEDEDLEKNLRLRIALEVHESDIEELRERLGNLTPSQRRVLLGLLLSMAGDADKVKLKIEEKEDRILVKMERRLGRSKLEIRDGMNRLTEEVRLRAEVFDDLSLIRIEYKFRERGGAEISSEDLVSRVLENIQLTEAEASALIRLTRNDDSDEAHDAAHELEDDSASNGDRLRVKIEIKEKDRGIEARVEFRGRLVSNSIDKESIVRDYVSWVSALTADDLLSSVRMKEDDDSSDDNEGEDEREDEGDDSDDNINSTDTDDEDSDEDEGDDSGFIIENVDIFELVEVTQNSGDLFYSHLGYAVNQKWYFGVYEAVNELSDSGFTRFGVTVAIPKSESPEKIFDELDELSVESFADLSYKVVERDDGYVDAWWHSGEFLITLGPGLLEEDGSGNSINSAENLIRAYGAKYPNI